MYIITNDDKHVKNNVRSLNQCKLLKLFVLVHFVNVNVSAYRTHWPHTDNHNYNHNQNHIGPYLDGGDGYRPPDHAYDVRQPKDIMVDIINNMGLALLEAHNEHNENNIAISPYGATSVLVALLEGLIGEAAHEIKIAMQLPPDLAVLRIGLRDIHRHLKSYFIPKEGFLAGLTLSHDNITLNREYQSILKFYGYDIESFNSPVYPDVYTTSTRPAVTMTTGKITTTTIGMETRTMETETSTIEMTTESAKTTTISPETTANGNKEGSEDGSDITDTSITEGATKSPMEGTTGGLTEGITEVTTIPSTTEIPSTTTYLPSPSDEDVDGTTTKKLPTRSYTTETIDVTDMEGRTETFYPITTIGNSESDLENTPMEDPLEETSEVYVEVPLTEESIGDVEIAVDVETDPTLTTGSKEELQSTSRDYEITTMLTESISTDNTREATTNDIDNLSSIDVSLEDTSLNTRNVEFFEATTNFPGGSGNGLNKISGATEANSSSDESSTMASSTTQNSISTTTTFEGTTFFAMNSYSTEAEFNDSIDINTQQADSDSIDSTTENANTDTTSTTESLTTTTTQLEDFITLTERDNEIMSEISQKLINLELNDTITAQPTQIPVSEITFTTSEPLAAYTQTQNTEATSLEDQILSNKTYQISGKILPTEMSKMSPKSIPKRRRRSVVDYLIARYYDNYYINNNRRYVPPMEMEPKTHYSNYEPEQPYTFLVNGKHKETNISFMTYDTILPFYYIRSLDAMALSFPLDSNMYYLLLVLPLDPHGIDKLIYDLRKATSLRHIVERLQYTHVKAVIPSFMLKGYVVLTPTFQKLCIRKIFEPRHANFSPMTPEPNLYVTNIEQAVTVTIRNYVDPASHSARNLNQYRPVEFRADHPFLYFVMDSQIHVNLMAGKIINPLNSRISSNIRKAGRGKFAVTMVFGPFLDFFGRTFSECRCRPDSKVDPIEFSPGAAINVGYHWLSFFKRLTVPPYAAIPTAPCRPPCRKKCCKPRRNPGPCNPICQRRRKFEHRVKCGGPCCRPWVAPPIPPPEPGRRTQRRKRKNCEPDPRTCPPPVKTEPCPT